MTDELIASNLSVWEDRTRVHVKSEFYDVEGFVTDPARAAFDHIVREVVGDVTGERVLHLQCHFGMDTLRFALMGAASVTGVDFSPAGIAEARTLAERMGIDATFVECDVRDLPPEVPLEAFDVVFTSYGVISWLPELRSWARTIASRLAPGGVFKIVEMHPTLWCFEETGPEPPAAVAYPYFDTEPLRWEEHGSYADLDADIHGISYSWQHTFEEIIGSLIGEGLVIESLREYPLIAWQHMPFMEHVGEGLWKLPDSEKPLPLMFSLTARKPE